MQVAVEDAGRCKKKLSVEISPEEIEKKLSERYDQMRKELTVPGFRRGRVPRRILERRFGEEVNAQVREQLIRDQYEKALKEQELEPVGEPELDSGQEKLDTEKPLTFTVTVEVRPKIELSDYKALTVIRPQVTQTDEEVEREIERLREVNAHLAPVEQGTIEGDDQVVCSASVLVEEKEVWSRERTSFALSSPRVAGIPVEGVREQLIGKGAGNSVTLSVTLPESFHEEFGGREARLRLTIIEFRRPVLPEKNDEWAKEIGYESLEALRASIAKEIGRSRESTVRSTMIEQIAQQLLARHEFEVPQSMIEAEIRHRTNKRRTALLDCGLSHAEVDGELSELAKAITAEAERVVKLRFLFEAIAEKEQIFLTEDELNKYIEENYAVETTIVEQIRERMEGGQLLDALRQELRRQKVVEFLLEHAVVSTENEAEEPAQPLNAEREELPHGTGSDSN